LLPQLKSHKPLKERVYKLLKDSILNGDLEPGQKLSQGRLAKQMKVSRMPIRQAIERLRTEGLIENAPYKESKVANFSHKDIEETYNLRALLESYSARLAVCNIRAEDLKELKKINKKMEECFFKKNYGKVNINNKKFHLTIYNRSGNNRLYNIIKNLWNNFPKDIFWKFSERVKNSILEHKKIVRAIEKGDEQIVEQLIFQHIENTKNRLLKITDQSQKFNLKDSFKNTIII
jgi:DNA-binding GntR family transcriptional regulator